MFCNSLQSMNFCNFCAKKHEKLHKISENFIFSNKTTTIQEVLKIFHSEITKFLLRNSDTIICIKCLKLLKSSYEFVEQIKEATSNKSPAKDYNNDRDNIEINIETDVTKVTVNKNLRLEIVNESSNNFKTILPKTSSNGNNCKQITKKTLNMKGRLYKCLECAETFKSFKQLQQHELEFCTNTLNGIFSCKYCHTCFKKEDGLTEHQIEKHNIGQFLCCLCKDKIFTAKGYLTRHIEKLHQHLSLQYYCGECKDMVELTTQDELREHFLEKHSLDTQKEATTAEFNDDDMDIEMHEEFLDEFLLAHTNENSFQFSECWEALDLHLPDMLQETSSTNLSNHQEFKEAFPCPKCLEQFKQPQPFLQHLAEKHNLPVLLCRNCRKSFASLNDFKMHKQTKCLPNNKTDPLSLDCPYCKKVFQNSLKLKQHLRIVHTQLKRHICQLCDQQFSTLDHLKKHVLSQHQNERKHVCNVCDKSFTQLGHLKQHLAIHTTGKTLQCPECSLKYWRKIDLNRHMKKIHGGA